MATMTATTKIDATPERVWEVLSDFGGISRAAPHLTDSVLTTDFQKVLETCRGHQRDARPFALEQCVGCNRRAVANPGTSPGTDSLEAGQNGALRSAWSRKQLHGDCATIHDCNNIGERSAGVDAHGLGKRRR